MSNIGERLREERERLGVSQSALGAIGRVQKQAQLKYEKGERYPDAAYLEAIAKAGADIQYIITNVYSAAALTSDEVKLLAMYRAVPLQVRVAVSAALTAALAFSSTP